MEEVKGGSNVRAISDLLTKLTSSWEQGYSYHSNANERFSPNSVHVLMTVGSVITAYRTSESAWLLLAVKPDQHQSEQGLWKPMWDWLKLISPNFTVCIREVTKIC